MSDDSSRTRRNAPEVVMVSGLSQPTRLDKLLRATYPQAGRLAVESLISGRQVRVNGQLVWLGSWQVRNGDLVEVAVAPVAKPQPMTAFDDAWIVAEESDLIVVAKPAGLLSEPARWTDAPSLVGLATVRFGPLALFHRLDRDTSGLVLLTRSGELNRFLDTAFKAGTVDKEYLAVVARPNRLGREGVIAEPLAQDSKRRDKMAVVARGGQRAVTRYEVIAETADKQWVRLWPQTGRMHQLRVHLAYLGAPILGDRLYNPRYREANRLMLHARRIGLPAGNGFGRREFEAPVPGDFLRLPN